MATARAPRTSTCLEWVPGHTYTRARAGADELGFLAAHQVVVATDSGDDDGRMGKIRPRGDVFNGQVRAVGSQRQPRVGKLAHAHRRRGHAGDHEGESRQRVSGFAGDAREMLLQDP